MDQQELPDRLCRALVSVLNIDGAAISVYLGRDMAVPVGASDVNATTAEALQFTFREGPCLQSYARRQPVLIPHLREPDSTAWSRWPTYTAHLTKRTDYESVFVYPLLAGGVALGALSLYLRRPGAPAEPGVISQIAAWIADRLMSAEMFTDTDTDGRPVHQWTDTPSSHRRRQVWLAQALTVQANRLTPAQAIDLLRAQAYTADRLLDDLAGDIVSGRLPIPILRTDD